MNVFKTILVAILSVIIGICTGTALAHSHGDVATIALAIGLFATFMRATIP